MSTAVTPVCVSVGTTTGPSVLSSELLPYPRNHVVGVYHKLIPEEFSLFS